MSAGPDGNCCIITPWGTADVASMLHMALGAQPTRHVQYTLVQQLPDLHPAFSVPHLLQIHLYHVCVHAMYLTAEGSFLVRQSGKGLVPDNTVLFSLIRSLN